MAAASAIRILISHALRSRQLVPSEPSTRLASFPATGAGVLTISAPSETHRFLATFTGNGAPGVGVIVKPAATAEGSLSSSALLAVTL